MLGVRHKADDVSALIGDASYIASTSIGIDVEIASDYAPFSLKLIEGFLVGNIATFTIFQWNHDFLTGFEVRSPSRGRTLNAQFLIATDEVQVIVTDERPGKQVRFAQNLKTIANTEDRESALGCINQWRHHRCEASDGSTAEVVAIREPTGQHHCVNTMQISVCVPERNSLTTGYPDGPSCIAIVE
jgi:hypothetical protein